MKNCPFLLVAALMALAVRPSRAEAAKNGTDGSTDDKDEEDSGEGNSNENEMFIEVDPKADPSAWEKYLQVNEGIQQAIINGKTVYKMTKGLRKHLKLTSKTFKKVKNLFKKGFSKIMKKLKFPKMKAKFKKLFKLRDPETQGDEQPELL